MTAKLQNNPLWLAGYAWAADKMNETPVAEIREIALAAPSQDEFVIGVLQALADHDEVARLNKEME